MNASRCCIVILVVFLAPLAMAAEPAARPLIVGHRGLMQHAPENTLAAFRACLALRVGFEFDVRRTKDGQLVCLHDDTLERTTSGQGALADLLLDELRKLDAGSRFDLTFRGERAPLIEEIMTLAGAQAMSATLLAVDLKDAGGGLEEAVVRLAEKHNCLERLVFIGLTIESSEIRAKLHGANPRAAVARLAKSADEVAEVTADKLTDWVYVRFVPVAEQVRRIHEQGKRVFLAGPLVAGREPENWRKAAEAGIDAILTDYPLEMRQQVGRPRE